jgi:hypothetical protein
MKKFIPTLPELFVYACIFLLLYGLCYQPPAAEHSRDGNELRKQRVTHKNFQQ